MVDTWVTIYGDAKDVILGVESAGIETYPTRASLTDIGMPISHVRFAAQSCQQRSSQSVLRRSVESATQSGQNEEP